MVGGIVEAIAHKGGIKLITVVDGKDIARVRIKNTFGAHAIKPGDNLWWQAGKAYWTPNKNNVIGQAFVANNFKVGKQDIPFTKIANSY